MMNLDIKQMRYLVKLAELRSFTHAAQALYTSQPALSTFVSRVEGELGVKLFDRSTSPLTLTGAGEIYIEELRRICEKAETADRQMADIVSNKRGELRVGFPSERAAAMLPYILPAYNKLYPNIAVKVAAVSSNELVKAIEEKRISLGVIPETEGIVGMACHEICSEELFLVDGCGFIRKNHLADGTGNCVDVGKLDGMPLVALHMDHAIRIFSETLFKQYGIKPRLIREVPSNVTAYLLAASGMGTAIIPALTLNLAKKVENAKIYRLSEDGTYWKVIAISDKNVRLGDVEQDFIQCMKKAMQEKWGVG